MGTRVGSYKITPANGPNNAAFSAALNQKGTSGNYLIVWVHAFNNSTTVPSWTPDSSWTVLVPQGSVNGTTGLTSYAVYGKPSNGTETAMAFTGVSALSFVTVAVEHTGVTGFDVAATVVTSTAAGAQKLTTSYTASSATSDHVLSLWGFAPNSGNGTTVAAGTWSGGAASDLAQTEVDADGVSGGGNQQDIAVGVQQVAASTTAAPAYSYTSPATTSTSPAYLITFGLKNPAATGGSSGHAVGALYPTPTLVSGSKDLLSSTVSTATSNSKVSVPALTLNAVSYEYKPETTNSTSGTVPTSGTAWNQTGWESAALVPLNDPGTLLAGSATFTASLTASATGTTAGFTVILYLAGTEIARASSTAAALPASAATQSVTLTWAQTAIPAGGKLSVDVWLNATGNTAALNATTVSLNYTASGTTLGAGAAYTIQAKRTSADTGAGSDSSVRLFTGKRTSSDTAAAVESSVRATTLRRTTTDASGTVADSSVRIYAAARASTDTAAPVESSTRLFTGYRTSSDTATGADSSVRGVTYGRFSADGPADVPLRYPTKVITGVTRDNSGAVLPGCTVTLLRLADGVIVASTTSDSTTGVYTLPRDLNDLNGYALLSVKPGSNPVLQAYSAGPVVPS